MGYICKNCNSSVPEGSNYCTFCGAPVEDSYTNADTKSNTSKGVVIGFIAIAVIAVIGVVLSYKDFSTSSSDDLETEISKEENPTQEAEPTEDIFEEDDDILWGTKSDPLVYSCGGITFEIPENFGYADGYFYSEYSTLGIYSEVVEEGFWETYYTGTGKDYDELADATIPEFLEDPYRELALDSKVAGEKSRYYIYSGIVDGQEEKILFEFVLNSNNENLIVLMLRTDANHSEINDYIDMVNNAEYTGAADSSQNPRSPFYIDPESIEDEPVDGYE
ncbi:zinc-ribbon domain-containing protein [Pseudobutyrivibrio ruminis]|uniref:Zinc-ribbon domain-containing protein n=1 Tax=Pseudobutyrivibrio ruminis DSM 9787 TaxID=1123011 RepID=A0A285T551_9FIRM|nr:zinc-ribbon domain-containing protein [Pseudobutyrivibrio ruminis]SOC16491.1 hypothetical protein SAMN02910411_0418 [Pseudobutyrivibrio ruminis DSM 9787]